MPSVASVSNTTYATRTNTTVTAPSGITDGDLLLLFAITAADPAAPAVTPPAGFTLWEGTWPQPITDGFFVIATSLYYKYASSESGNYTFTHANCSSQGAMFRISTPHPTEPIEDFTVNIGEDATTTWLGLTTTQNNTLILLFETDWSDNTNNTTPPTGSTPTFTEHIDVTTIYAASGVLATAGATGNKTHTNNNRGDITSPWLGLMLALAPPPPLAPPTNVTPPAITGLTVEGATLASDTGTWAANPAPTFGYQWRRDGTNIGGATSSTYTLQTADIGATITCRVTATNSEGSAFEDSNGLGPITPQASTGYGDGAYGSGTYGVRSSGGQVVALQSSAAAASGTLALTAPTQVPLAASSAVASATLALRAPTQVPLAASSAVAVGTLALRAPAILSLDASAAVASATLGLRAPALLPFQASAALADAALALRAPTQIPFAASAAVATGTLTLSVPTVPILPLDASVAVASGTLGLRVPTELPVQASAAIATATLALRANAILDFQAGVAAASGSLALRAPALISMAATAVGSGTLDLKAPAILPFNAGTAVAQGSLGLRAPPSLALAGAAVASGSLALTAPVLLSLAARGHCERHACASSADRHPSGRQLGDASGTLSLGASGAASLTLGTGRNAVASGDADRHHHGRAGSDWIRLGFRNAGASGTAALPLAQSAAVATGTLALRAPVTDPPAARRYGFRLAGAHERPPIWVSAPPQRLHQQHFALTAPAHPDLWGLLRFRHVGRDSYWGGSLTLTGSATASGSLGFRRLVSLVSSAQASGTLLLISPSTFEQHYELNVEVSRLAICSSRKTM